MHLGYGVCRLRARVELKTLSSLLKRKSFRKREVANPEHVREINKQSVRKRKINNPEYVREINKQSVRKRKADRPMLERETNKQSILMQFP